MERHLQEEKAYKDELSTHLFDIIQLRNNKDKSCLSLVEELLEEAYKNSNTQLTVELLTEQALNECSFYSDYKKAIKHALEAYHFCSDEPSFLLTKIYNCSAIGNIYSYLGELTLARNFYSDAIQMLESIDHPNHYVKRQLGSNYFNLTNLYRNTTYNETRLGYLEKAKNLFLEINYKIGYARCLNSFSIYHPDYKGTELGLQNYLEAEKLFRELGDKRGLGVVLLNIGAYYSEHNEYEKGIFNIDQAIELLEEVGQKKFICNAFMMRGSTYSNNGYPERGIEDFKKCQKLLNETESKYDQLSLYLEWSYALEKLGDFKQALSLLRKHSIAKEELDQFDKKSALSEEKIAFELQEKEKEANLLRKKNEEIEAYSHQLEISNNDLKRFAHIASHDMKEPLRMVNLYVQMLERSLGENATKEQNEFMNFAKIGSDRMYNLINSVLNLNNIHPSIKKEQINLNEIIESTAINLKILIEEKNVQLNFSKLPTIRSDKELLLQVFQNLINNAIKYNKSNPIEISIHSNLSDKYQEIRVADNGIGIDPLFRTKVFEIFHRLNEKDEYEGTGIGLTIVKKIMDTLQGRIHIEDNSPQGSIFVLQFPL